MPSKRIAKLAALPAALVLAALVAGGQARAQDSSSECPAYLPKGTACHLGKDENGAFYLIAIPENWNKVLIVHSHGGPRLTPPKQDGNVEDLERFASLVNEGYAWAGTTYRREGYGARMGADDSETVRKIFWEKFGKPRRTIIHGQSWGGNVAAKAIELYGKDAKGETVYDGVVLTSGVLAGGTRAYDFRADLRAVYQYYCKNHPKPDEAQYPLWQGLPADSKLARKDLEDRINECTGVRLKPEQRSEAQKRNLADIVNVVRIAEGSLVGHIGWATFTFSDLVNKRLGGRNPFTNEGVVYSGSHDDAALNAGVQRFKADPQGFAALADDSDMTGQVPVPVVTMHAINDPTAFVENEAAYRETLAKAGRADGLVQVFTREAEHSKLNTPQYPALFNALLEWIDAGKKPTPQGIAASCETFVAKYKEPCLIDPAYQPPPYAQRVYPRKQG